MNILSLIQTSEELAAQERQRKEKLEAEITSAAQLDIQKVLDEITAGLECKLGDWIHVMRGQDTYRVSIKVKIDGFEPFYVFTETGQYRNSTLLIPAHQRVVDIALTTEDPARNTHLSDRISWTTSDKGRFFKKLKDRYDERKRGEEAAAKDAAKRALENEIKSLSHGFTAHFGQGTFYQSVEQATEALESLKALDPARSDEFQAEYDRWFRSFTEEHLPWVKKKQEEKRQAEERKQRLAEDAERFRREYLAYEQTKRQVLAFNDPLIKIFQETYEGAELEIYDLEYSTVANYEGEILVDTESVACLWPAAGEDMHRVIERRRVRNYKYMNIVRISAPYKVKVRDLSSPGKVSLYPYLGWSRELYYNPTLDKGFVENHLSQSLKKIPSMPDNGLLESHDIFNVRKDVLENEFGEEWNGDEAGYYL